MADGDSRLPPGACIVSVMHMVDPGNFWISEPLTQDMTEERGRLQEMEDFLQTHCHRSSLYNKGTCLLEPGEMIAVQHPETHRWHRAIVEEVLILASAFKYRVFLVDHGVPLQVCSSSIQNLPDSCKSLSYQAVQLVLHEVIPVAREIEYEFAETKLRMLDHWTTSAVRFVKKLLDDSVKIYVVCYRNKKEVIYGDLYLELVNGVVSLKKELCENEFAIISQDTTDQDCEIVTSAGSCFGQYFRSSVTTNPTSAKPEHRSIRDYLREHNEKKSVKAKDIPASIEPCRQQPNEPRKESNNDDEEIPIGRGTSLRRKHIEQTVKKVTIDDSSEKLLEEMSMLSLLDMLSGESESPQKQVDSEKPRNKSVCPKEQGDSQSITYRPAGAPPSYPPSIKTHPNSESMNKKNKVSGHPFNTHKSSAFSSGKSARYQNKAKITDLSVPNNTNTSEPSMKLEKSTSHQFNTHKSSAFSSGNRAPYHNKARITDLSVPNNTNTSEPSMKLEKSTSHPFNTHKSSAFSSGNRAPYQNKAKITDLSVPNNTNKSEPSMKTDTSTSHQFNNHKSHSFSSGNRSPHQVYENKAKITDLHVPNNKDTKLSETLMKLDKKLSGISATDSRVIEKTSEESVPLKNQRLSDQYSGGDIAVINERLKEQVSESSVSVTHSELTPKDTSVSVQPAFDKSQGKMNSTKNNDVMQKVMTGVIKSAQSKSQLQFSNHSKSPDQNQKNAFWLPRDYKLLDKSVAARLLVHGDMRSRPIQSIAEANFPPEIHQALGKMNFKSPMRIQMYAWPAIMRGQYTVLVGPSRSGKTLSYVVPIVSFMLTPDVYSELPPGNGPLVLVLCSGSKSAEFVYESCCKLLQLANRTDIRVQIALGGNCQIDLRDQLANGCDILVSTPRCFMRLFGCSPLITNLNRVAHLVIEEVDILAEKFLPEVKLILGKCRHVLMKRSNISVPIQLIAASQKWCPAVEQFSQNVSQDFVVCISGYLEAAVYAKLQPTLHYLSDESKARVLLDILDGYRGLYKTLVVCKDAAEVDMLQFALQSQCYHVLSAHVEQTIAHNKETIQSWKMCVPGSSPVLVCTDDILPELDINDAMWLIHYSLPPTKTMFGFRFSSLMNNYKNVFLRSSENEDAPECTVHIFVDKDNNDKQLPGVVEFMKRLSCPVHPELEAKADELVKAQEVQKNIAPLCYNMKAFGECLQKKCCPNRHAVSSSLDEPVNIPRTGNVKLKITHVLDASRFAARLLEYKDEDGSTVQVSSNYFAVTRTVYNHYSSEKNRGLHGLPKLGDICGLESKINTFQRVQVVEIVKQDEKNIPEEVRVHLMDEGIYKEVKVFQLLSLPANLKEHPPQTVEVFLCNVAPCDLDTCWSQAATYKMSAWIHNITENEKQGNFVTGKILLSLGNTLWLDPLISCSHLKNVDTVVTEVSLRTELLSSKLAVENPNHMKTLLNLCKQAQIEIPDYQKVKKAPIQKQEVLPTPQWAFLTQGDYHAVEFVCANNPDEFYVRRADFNKCFTDLIAEIKKYVKTAKPKNFHVVEGSLCVGKFPGDKVWYRACVKEILEDGQVSLFFVDHGDVVSVSLDDVLPITHKLITRLPFQAIECSLAGVRPLHGDSWSDDAIDLLYELTEDCTTLDIKVCEVLDKARCTGGRKYQVLCVDTRTEENIMLNQELVERGLATSSDMELFKDSPSRRQDDSGDESDIEVDNCLVKLEDACKEVKPSDMIEDSAFEEDLYDVEVDDIEGFVKNMLGLNKLINGISPPSQGNQLYALPAPSSPLQRAPSLESLPSYEDGIPPLASHFKTPDVLWYQDNHMIGIRINLPGVEQYYLEWDAKHFKFRCDLKDDIYEVGDELFGPVDPQLLWHSAKGLYVHIKFRKAVSGFLWPRLFNFKTRRLWLKYDLEMKKNDSGISLEDGDTSKTSGISLNERNEAKIIPDLDDTDEEDDYNDYDDELDPWEREDIDPLDPLS